MKIRVLDRILVAVAGIVRILFCCHLRVPPHIGLQSSNNYTRKTPE